MVVRPPGQGRRARARRRQKLREEQEQVGPPSSTSTQLLHLPLLHGNTMPGRWKGLDKNLATVLEELFPDDERKIAIDIGVGETPCTTLEFAAVLPDGRWHVVGTECHEQRLERARQQHTAPEKVTMLPSKLALDSLPLLENKQRPHLVRALNVLRDYGLEDTCQILHTLCRQLDVKQGVLFEGSCSPMGDFWCVLMTGSAATISTVVFGTTHLQLSTCWSTSFQACLPRIWRHCYDSDSNMPWAQQVKEFMIQWEGIKPRVPFVESVSELATLRPSSVDTSMVEQGVMVWKPPQPIAIPLPPETRTKRA